MMKYRYCLLLSIIIFACGVQNGNRHYFPATKQAEQIKERAQNYYAHYRFMLEGYEDIDVVIKVVVEDGIPATLHVKDLAPNLSGQSSEEIALWVSEEKISEHNPDEKVLDFGGRSASGAVYTGELTLYTGGNATCCGEMTYASSEEPSAIYLGNRTNDSNETEWNILISK